MPAGVGNLLFFLILILAGCVEIYVRFGPVRRREILSWLNWTLAVGIANAIRPSELDLIQSLLLGLAYGGLGQPVLRLAVYLRLGLFPFREADRAREQALVERRRRYHPTAADFGGPPPAKPPQKALPPDPIGADPPTEPSSPPINLRLYRATSERRPGWARQLEVAAVVVVTIIGIGLSFWLVYVNENNRRHNRVDAAAAQEVLLATLELAGHEIPRVRRIRMASPCPIGQIGYRWTALDGRGRACVDSSLAVDITVDEQWPARR